MVVSELITFLQTLSPEMEVMEIRQSDRGPMDLSDWAVERVIHRVKEIRQSCSIADLPSQWYEWSEQIDEDHPDYAQGTNVLVFLGN